MLLSGEWFGIGEDACEASAARPAAPIEGPDRPIEWPAGRPRGVGAGLVAWREAPSQAPPWMGRGV